MRLSIQNYNFTVDFLFFLKNVLIYDNWKTGFRKKSYEKKADS